MQDTELGLCISNNNFNYANQCKKQFNRQTYESNKQYIWCRISYFYNLFKYLDFVCENIDELDEENKQYCMAGYANQRQMLTLCQTIEDELIKYRCSDFYKFADTKQ